MKGIVSLAAICVMAGLLVACGGSDSSSDKSTSVAGPNVSGKGEGKLNMVILTPAGCPFTCGRPCDAECRPADAVASTAFVAFVRMVCESGGQISPVAL